MQEELTRYLDALDGGDCYRVDSVLKQSPHEITERVYFIGANGEEQGPFVRKRFGPDSKMGLTYERILETQNSGKRFLHIPRILRYESDASGRFVLMEWVTGESLEDLVRREGASCQLAESVFPLLCDAVSELHEGFDPPVIHRDLTPSNVIVSQGGLTLIDFGIARTYDEEAAHDTTCFGTRAFAPPEQFGYGQTTVRSDVYALGMMLLYCLTGNEPLPAQLEEALGTKDVSPEMWQVLSRATAFDPRERYASVRELKSSFMRAVVMQTGEVGRPAEEGQEPRSFLQRIPKWLGITWNALVISIWAIFAIAAVSLTFFPTEQVVEYPLAARVFLYIGIFAVAFAFIAYLLLDKRRLRKRIKFISGLSWRKEFLYCVVMAFAVILFSALIGGAIAAMT